MRPGIEPFGVERLAGQLQRRSEAARNVRPVFREFVDLMHDTNAARLDRQKGWRKLDPDTIRQKAQQGLDPRKLHATGRLRASLTRRGARGSVVDIGSDEVFVGTDLFYARFLRGGTKHMPRRSPVGLRKVDREAILDIVRRHLRGGR